MTQPKSGRRRGGSLLPSLAVLMIGSAAGMGVFTFVYGEGHAYLSPDPAVCTNCHVMQGHFDSWQASSHHGVAVCNDCHLAPDFVGKWVTKADNGLLHAFAFTTGEFPDPIRIKPRNARRTQAACLHCHEGLFHALTPEAQRDDSIRCANCHSAVGHAQR